MKRRIIEVSVMEDNSGMIPCKKGVKNNGNTVAFTYYFTTCHSSYKFGSYCQSFNHSVIDTSPDVSFKLKVNDQPNSLHNKQIY